MIVHLDSNRTIEGVLVSARGEYIALRAAEAEHDGKMRPADGVVMIPRRRIEFVQVVA